MRKDVTADPAVVAEVLDAAMVLHLALVEEDGPYSLPINFAFSGGKLYIHFGPKGRKVEALRRGTPVGFSAVGFLEPKTGKTACTFGYRFRSVVGKGRPRFLEGSEKMEALRLITARYAGSDVPMEEAVAAKTLAVEITLDWATARIKE